MKTALNLRRVSLFNVFNEKPQSKFAALNTVLRKLQVEPTTNLRYCTRLHHRQTLIYGGKYFFEHHIVRHFGSAVEQHTLRNHRQPKGKIKTTHTIAKPEAVTKVREASWNQYARRAGAICIGHAAPLLAVPLHEPMYTFLVLRQEAAVTEKRAAERMRGVTTPIRRMKILNNIWSFSSVMCYRL